MSDKHIALITYANQSKGPVPSGLMLEGLPHLAGILLSEGYIPRIFDYNSTRSVKRIAEVGCEEYEKEAAEEIISYINQKSVKIAGFTLYNNGLQGILRIASIIKKYCHETTLIAGGPVINYVKASIYDMTDVFDVIGVSEGYKTITSIADYAYKGLSLSKVPNLIFRDGTVTSMHFEDISKIAFPTYDKEFYPDIDYKIHIPVVRGSVGCRYGRCSFCIQPQIDGTFRVRDLDDLVGEIEYLRERYRYKTLRLSDPNPYSEELLFLAENAPLGTKISLFGYSDTYYEFEKTKKILSGMFLGV
jgi:radical SAM superfamily enzyme YgiQ (UPF0313 family)